MKGWLRLYREALHDPKLLALTDSEHRLWFSLLCLADSETGILPPLETIAISLRLDVNGLRTVVERLANATLIDTLNGGPNGYRYAMHGWRTRQFKSDTSTERVKRFRNARRNVSETPSETETETEVRESSSRGTDYSAGAREEATTTTTIDEQILVEFEAATQRTRNPADELEARKLRDVALDSVRRGIAKSVRAVADGRVSSLRYCVPAILEAERARSQANVGAAPRPVAVLDPEPVVEVAVELEHVAEYSADAKAPVFAAAAAFIRRSAALSGEPPSRDELRRHLFERGCDLGVVDAIYPASIPSASSGPAISAVSAAKE